tara:strand:+ start:1602 stop:2000 length:399 start_codon:yes stop_codon:yes gene_type:complete
MSNGSDFRKLVDRLDEVVDDFGNPTKYFIMAGGGISEPYGSKTVNTPAEAIGHFFAYTEHAPTDVSIDGNEEDMLELINWAKANKELVGDMMTKYGADEIYHKERFLDNIDKAKLNQGFDEDSFTVYPFDRG